MRSNPDLRGLTDRVNLVVALAAEARPIVERFALKTVSGSGPFRIYTDDRPAVRLIISGVGREASARAVSFLYTHASGTEKAAWLNVGVAGHRDFPLGTAVFADRITDRKSGRSWSLPREAMAEVASLVTVDRPVTDYPGEELYEMEASGFCESTLGFCEPALVRVLKIVSDNQDSPVDGISAGGISGLIHRRIALVEQTVLSLGDLVSRCAGPEVSPTDPASAVQTGPSL
ncbi:MAG: hypothetical protein ACE5E4_09650 [Candidatus Binatia bacterium]